MEKAKTEKWSDFEDAHLRLSKGCHGKKQKLKHGVILKAPICFKVAYDQCTTMTQEQVVLYRCCIHSQRSKLNVQARNYRYAKYAAAYTLSQ